MRLLPHRWTVIKVLEVGCDDDGFRDVEDESNGDHHTSRGGGGDCSIPVVALVQFRLSLNR